MSSMVIFNGNILDENKVSISINNRSFRYGDGCFETIKVVNANILLAQYHFNRLFSSLETLQFVVPPDFNQGFLAQLITNLIELNSHAALARVRITFFRGDGGPYDNVDHHPNYIIQSWSGSGESLRFNEAGFVMDFFQDARKTSDKFSHIKSNNYLPYSMGALYAKKNSLNDCLIFNSSNRIAESTIANVFIVIDGVIKTPALTEGCVSGVMRKYLLSRFKADNLPVLESEIHKGDLLAASEVFLTNALYGIRWVSKVAHSNYSNHMSSLFYEKYIASLFSSRTF